MAAPAAVSNTPTLLAQMQFGFAQTLGSLRSTHIGALLTGKESQYEAMHQGPPNFEFGRPALPSPHLFPHGTQPFPPRHTRGPGVELVGPPMLHHPIIGGAQNASAHARPRSAQPLRVSNRKISAEVLRANAAVQNSTPSPTGINPWWTYEESTIPGVGRAMVNVANGNLLIQETDIDVPERGIDLAFRRTYNSLSGEDYAQTDGSAQPSAYGPGWTNTFDAHIAANSSGGYSIFDIDGARYDFTPNGQSGFNPPPGMEGTSLRSDGSCGFQWFKKNGTVYYFYEPVMANCGHPELAAYGGRLYQMAWPRFRGHLDRLQPMAGQKGDPWQSNGGNFRVSSRSKRYAA